MKIFKATTNDIEKLIDMRIDYLKFNDIVLDEDDTKEVRKQLESYFQKNLQTGKFVALVAEIDGEIVATAYLVVSEKPTNLLYMTGLTGTILNVLTYPPYRSRGIGTKMLEQIICEAIQRGVSSLELSVSAQERPLYEKMGFTEISSKQDGYQDMGLKLIV